MLGAWAMGPTGEEERNSVRIRGPVETQIGASRRPGALWTRVPSMAASASARQCGLDGTLDARRLQGPVKTRCKTREAFWLSRYMRTTALVNLLRSTRRAGKVEQMSRALALVALTHLRYMHSEHPFMLELAS